MASFFNQCSCYNIRTRFLVHKLLIASFERELMKQEIKVLEYGMSKDTGSKELRECVQSSINTKDYAESPEPLGAGHCRSLILVSAAAMAVSAIVLLVEHVVVSMGPLLKATVTLFQRNARRRRKGKQAVNTRIQIQTQTQPIIIVNVHVSSHSRWRAPRKMQSTTDSLTGDT